MEKQRCCIYDFHMFLWKSSDPAKYPTQEDITYIMGEFTKAAKSRGLVFGGSCEPSEDTLIKE